MQTQHVAMYAWFDPAQLTAIAGSFEHAWGFVEGCFDDDTSRQNARSKLAVIVIGLARTGMLERGRLRDAAILMMEPHLG